MLTPVTDLDALIASFWPAAQDVTRSAYPTYADGVKTYADFAAHLRSAHASDWGEVLLHDDDALLLIEAEDEAYVSLRLWAKGRQSAALAEALAWLRAHDAGYTLWLGFAPENAEMLAFARENGFALLDDSVNWVLPLEGHTPSPADASVRRVTREEYYAFRAVWTDQTMYWNADRIRDAFDRWTLFITRDGRAAVACMNDAVAPEIFGFQYRGGYDAAAHRALMAAVIRDGCESGAKHLNYFADHEESGVMTALGFRRVSDYVCYETKL